MTTKDTDTHNTPPATEPLALRLSDGLGPNAHPVAWMGGDGHPHHLRHLQTATDRRINGKWAALYDSAALDAAVAAERELIIGLQSDGLAGLIRQQERERCAALCELHSRLTWNEDRKAQSRVLAAEIRRGLNVGAKLETTAAP